MTKKVLVGLPSSLLDKIDFTAQAESRTRSDLIREALRRYLDNFQRQRLLQSTSSNIEILEETFANSPSMSSTTRLVEALNERVAKAKSEMERIASLRKTCSEEDDSDLYDMALFAEEEWRNAKGEQQRILALLD